MEVLSGQPYPELDDGVALTRLPSLDLYREPDPFRTPRPSGYDWVDVAEWATMCTAGFPEPMTFSLRAARRCSPDEFDVVHDNQSLGWGLLRLTRPASRPWPPCTTRSPSTASQASWRPRRPCAGA